MSTDVNTRVQKHRKNLRSAGFRPIQIWVPDTRRAGFLEECRRQSQIAAKADAAESEFDAFTEEAIGDVDGWTS